MLAEKARAAAAQAPVYIEDVFSTYLYTGTGASKTITNNIDLSGNGGLTWIKSRSAATGHRLTDTVRGVTKSLASETTAAEATESTGLTAFSTTGFTIGADGGYNTNTSTYASWTFRKQAKFFDIVTYTGTGANRTVAHNLGSVPGCIIVKRTDTTADWQVYHRSLANTEYLVLNTTAAKATGATRWNSTTPTSTEFSLGTDTTVNASGGTYVAYIYAHDAGGFGLSGSDNVISCGSFVGTGTANSPTITLGYEPQWLMIKKTNGTISADASSWTMWDTMRGIYNAGTDGVLWANRADQESTPSVLQVNSTGFQIEAAGSFYNESGSTYVYIAIRRGPMKVPTVGTSVYTAVAATGAPNPAWDSGFTVDAAIVKNKSSSSAFYLAARLTGNQTLSSNDADPELSNADYDFDYQLGWGTGYSDANLLSWMFQRAPGFIDVVCYTGTGANTTQTHNLGAVPELMIVKCRSSVNAWQVYSSGLANTEYLVLNTTAAKATGATRWNSTTPTSSVFSLGTAAEVNTSTETYVAYLFATAAGVSKVGSYTGTATTLQVNCGFAAGARFVMIKRTDSTGDWYFWDSARGIVAGNDPYLLLNVAAAEVTGTDYIDTYSAGFEISSTAPAAINASGGTFIFLAIA